MNKDEKRAVRMYVSADLAWDDIPGADFDDPELNAAWDEAETELCTVVNEDHRRYWELLDVAYRRARRARALMAAAH